MVPAVGYEDGPVIDMPPVTDWVNDWDWLDPQWGPNAIEIWNSVRGAVPGARRRSATAAPTCP